MQNLEKSMISKLIETAMEQLKFSIHPIQILRWCIITYKKRTDLYRV